MENPIPMTIPSQYNFEFQSFELTLDTLR